MIRLIESPIHVIHYSRFISEEIFRCQQFFLTFIFFVDRETALKAATFFIQLSTPRVA